MAPRPPRSILALTEEIIEDRAPQDVPILSVVSQAFYEMPAVRRKMAATVEAIYRTQSPTAFDASDGSLVLQLTLVLMNGAATGAFDDATAERGRPVTDWLARRRLSWRLRRRRAARGAETAIPALPPARVTQIAGHARRLAGRCGLSESEAEAYAGRLVSVLEGAPV